MSANVSIRLVGQSRDHKDAPGPMRCSKHDKDRNTQYLQQQCTTLGFRLAARTDLCRNLDNNKAFVCLGQDMPVSDNINAHMLRYPWSLA